MSSNSEYRHRRTGSLYAAFCFGTVVVCGFGSFFSHQTYYTSERWVPVVFLFGALYAVLGIVTGYSHRSESGTFWAYYVFQCALLTGIIFLSPTRGFMAIVALPLLSQALFDLRAPFSTAIGLYLYGISVGVWAIPLGWTGAWEAGINYLTAYGFTVAFTLITRRALVAREREEKLRQQVEAANLQLREHAAQAEDLATTRERNRVAREIHDGVGHYLTVVKTQLDAAAALLPAQPERAREAVVKAAQLSAEALDDVRRSVGALRTDVARPPLPEALRALTDELGVPVALKIEGPVRALSPAVEHVLFRSAQEGLTNIRKHAGASSAELALDFRPADRVCLAVMDNGRGAAAATGAGFGLRGIRERVELLGGRVESGNRATGGFALQIDIPA